MLDAKLVFGSSCWAKQGLERDSYCVVERGRFLVGPAQPLIHTKMVWLPPGLVSTLLICASLHSAWFPFSNSDHQDIEQCAILTSYLAVPLTPCAGEAGQSQAGGNAKSRLFLTHTLVRTLVLPLSHPGHLFVCFLELDWEHCSSKDGYSVYVGGGLAKHGKKCVRIMKKIKLRDERAPPQRGYRPIRESIPKHILFQSRAAPERWAILSETQKVISHHARLL